jgi:hypothetical protein
MPFTPSHPSGAGVNVPLLDIGIHDLTTLVRLAAVGDCTYDNKLRARNNHHQYLTGFGNTKLFALVEGLGLDATDAFLGSTAFPAGASPEESCWRLTSQPLINGHYEGMFVEGPHKLMQPTPQGRLWHDVFTVWTNPESPLLHLRTKTPSPWKIFPSRQAFGAIMGQVELRGGAKKARIVLVSYEATGSSQLKIGLRHVTLDIPNDDKAPDFDSVTQEPWQRALISRAFKVFRFYCKPTTADSQPYWETMLDDYQAIFARGSHGNDWQKDFDRVETPWDLVAACRLRFGPATDGVPIVQKARQALEEYMAQLTRHERSYMEDLWQLARNPLVMA